MQIKNIFIMLATLLLSVNVYAGMKQPAPVTIEYFEGGGHAQGDMNTARFSDNDFEFIGCGLRSYDDGVGGAFHLGFCQASVEEGGTVTCFVDDNPELMEGLNILSDSSFITFSWDDDGNDNLTCIRIGSSTQSFYLIKSKSK